MRVIGIDPGSITTGYGIVESRERKLLHIESGGLFTKARDPIHKRLQSIYAQLKNLLEKYAPDAIALEEVFLANNVRSTIHLGHARGIALLAIAEADIPFFEYSTKEIKKATVGYGNATKEQVQVMVKMLLNLPEITFADAADALAAAICHINSAQFTNRLRS